ncbi:B3/4 domain protein [Pseudomonas sp. 31 E 6]|uniref:B3/B4 domain-containing protein n=1 Tax=unclassified Pseudomonas TaxID=196821 RepID=UPI0008124673|nr:MULTISPECIES: B3/4 domain-containing protein [unclassified Pseudomonas]CRM01174.1 B3/4 domain protein [Pseudomonas sp. 31 E 6]CRM52273.1 B3/4 domain protein [Pseudomonas sp. 31 E 5]
MLSVLPLIDQAVAELAPQFRALSIVVQAAPLANPEVAQAALDRACKVVQEGGPSWGEAHLAEWAQAFRKFGAKPQRTPCSAEALRKRVLRDGSLPSLDPIVDLYNAISLEYAIPVGGENIEAYVGSPRLVVADGTEPFDTLKEGAPAVEYPDAGEVIWRDDQGVTCRRWNWRQGVRTRLGADAKSMWFILESLPAMPLEALTEAGDKLIEGLQQMMPGVQIQRSLIGAGGQ